MFWAKTLSSSPPAALITYWIETPEERGDDDRALQDVGAVGDRLPGRHERDLLRPHADAHLAGGLLAGRDVELRAVVGLDVFGVDDLRVDQVRDPEEVGDERGPGALVEVGGRARLLDLAAVHDRDRVGHAHGLLLVVRHVHERDADLLLDPLELDLQLLAQAQVERAERLVEEQRTRAVDERAGERDALLLTARELRRLALGQVAELDELQRVVRALGDLGLVDLLALEPERDVLQDGQMREQRVGLEDGVDVALVRRVIGDVSPAEKDAAGGRILEPADHPQGRGLPAAGRPEHREEAPARYRQRELVYRRHIGEALAHTLEMDVGLGLRCCHPHSFRLTIAHPSACALPSQWTVGRIFGNDA